MAVGGAVDEIDGVGVGSVTRTLHEHDVVDVPVDLPLRFRHEQRLRQHADRTPGSTAEERLVHRVHTVGAVLVEEGQQALVGGDRRCTGTDPGGPVRRADDRVIIEGREVLIPVLLPAVHRCSRSSIVGGKVRVRHHVPIEPTTANDLDPRVLDAVDTAVPHPSQHVGELVVQAIRRFEDRDVAHVVDETSPVTRDSWRHETDLMGRSRA